MTRTRRNTSRREIRNTRLGVVSLFVTAYLIMASRLPQQFISPCPQGGCPGVYLPAPEVQAEDVSAEDFIRQVFGSQGEVAVAVANAECNGVKPDCLNVTDREHSVCHFQINLKAHYAKVPGKNMAEKEAWLKNHQNCTIMAKIVHDMAGGFGPWSAYLSGAYLNYLND